MAIYAADDKGEQRNAKPAARAVIATGIHFVIGPYNSSIGIANLRLRGGAAVRLQRRLRRPPAAVWAGYVRRYTSFFAVPTRRMLTGTDVR